jgi:hypothetical protein
MRSNCKNDIAFLGKKIPIKTKNFPDNSFNSVSPYRATKHPVDTYTKSAASLIASQKYQRKPCSF